MESALRGMSQANMDLCIFQDTKCTDGIYTRESYGYRIVATDTPTREDRIFVALRRAVPKPHARDRHKNKWISEET